MSARKQPKPDGHAPPAGDDVATSSGLLLPGGQVDAQAIVDAAAKARELGLDQEDDEELRRVRFEIRRDLDKRLDKYLTGRISFLSRTQLQKLIDGGGVLVNERLPKSSTRLNAGDVVEVVVPAPPAKDIQPEDIPLSVMYEDEHIIVLNKQADIIVHPARSHIKGTMLSALAFHFRNRSATGGNLSTVGTEFARPGVVHRLDRDTTGCIVFAKQDEAHWKLGHAFEHRRVEKRYVALVHGKVEPVVDTLDSPIGPHPSREKGLREKQVVRHDELGKPSLTIARVLEWYLVPRPSGAGGHHEGRPKNVPRPGWNKAKEEGEGSGPRLGEPGYSEHESRPGGAGYQTTGIHSPWYSLVELELKTGRTHQIRVHLSHALHPIVGDDMYGGRVFTTADGREMMHRQALHAALLGFEHPITGAKLEFTAPLRDDMVEVVRWLRANASHQHVDAPGVRVKFDVLVGASS
jgi:23S rRNA pseudouridine1911/1915/1917 synthase